MDFLVNMLNHSAMGQRSLEDVVGIMGHQIRALGHKIVWETANVNFITRDRGYNIVVEGFMPGHDEMFRKAHEAGCRFICLATEEPTPRGFNHGSDPEMRFRQEYFPSAAQYFDGILHLVPGQNVTDWYGQFCPAAYAELGYAPSFIRGHDIEPTYEFVFFGSLSHRRNNILKRLARRCGNEFKPCVNAIRVCADFPDQKTRDAILRQGKVVLQLRKTERMGLVSSSRCNTALSCGRPVIAEPHDLNLSKPWDEIVHFTRTMEEFYLHALVVKATWRSVHAAQFDKFKTLLTPEICIGAPLRKIGVLSPLEHQVAA